MRFLHLLPPSSALAAAPTLATPHLSHADGPDDGPIPADQLAFFESKIRPVLIERCHECHSAESGKSKGGLTLDSRAGIRAGGDNGPAIVPGNPSESLLIAAISYTDEDIEMPPKSKLPDAVVADFKKWVAMGAPDPRTGVATLAKSEIDLTSGRSFWAYQKPAHHSPPAVKDTSWPRSDIDRFILAKLESQGLAPAQDADPHTLVRRLFFDLTGLPPSPDDVASFLQSYAADPAKALADTADRLLDSPRFGERWGRHWLDVARYAESSGKESNHLFPHAWRYRDYVIDSFNADKPFDQFVTEQLAGDLLEYRDHKHQAQLISATGFLALGPKSLNEQNARQFAMDVADEQIDVTTQAFLATTVACARCHDHKFDPIPAEDYYALAGIFLSSKTYYGTVNTLANRRAGDLLYLSGVDSTAVGKTLSKDELAAKQSRLAEAKADRNELLTRARDARKKGTDFNNGLLIRATDQVSTLEAEIASFDKNGRPFALAMGMWDKDSPSDSPVLIRGEIDKPTDPVPRGFVQVLCDEGEHRLSPGVQGSGRLEMARWIASPENPLTARVFANRAWHHIFGAGLVRSVDNFGSTGELPSHPELLDYLALRFTENGWSVKSLIRDLVLTRTYQLASTFDPHNATADPENRLLWHMPKRRLQAEAIRDAILAVSGNLDLSFPHASPVAFAGDGTVGRSIQESQLTGEGDHNRSVFLPIVRDLVPDALDAFDFPDPSLPSGARDSTNVPSQALYLMNSQFVQSQADAFAKRLLDHPSQGAEKLAHAFVLAYARPPTPNEAKKTTAFFQRFHETARKSGISPEDATFLALSTYCQSLFASAEFRCLD